MLRVSLAFPLALSPMLRPLPLLLLVLLVLPEATRAQAAAPTAGAPAFEGLHLIRSWTDDVKLDGGAEEARRIELLFDYATGRTLERVYGPAGALLSERALDKPVPASLAEKAAAEALVLADAEVAALRAQGAEVDGGFLYAPETGPCGPGGRCLQFDVMSADRKTSVRYAIVNLRAGAVDVLDGVPVGSR